MECIKTNQFLNKTLKKCLKVEVNSERKNQLEETANKSIINESVSAKANGSHGTFNDSKNISNCSSARRSSDLQQQISKNITTDERSSIDLLVNDQENFGISENHSINNNINNNNNNITNKIDDAESDKTIATINNDSAIDHMQKFTNREMVNIVNDRDNTRLYKNANTDVGRLVGSLFLMDLEKKLIFCFLLHNLL